MKFHTLDRISCLSALLVVGALCPDVVNAGWGSLHGNNRSPAPARPASPHPEPATPRPEAQPADHGQPKVFDHSRPAPVAVDRARADQSDRQRMDIGEERRQSAFWSDYHAGMRIDRLPDGFRSIGVRGHPYFYFQGVFYDNGPSGYVVIAPPVDAVVTDMPPDSETVVVGDTTYYYAGGAFYVQQSDGTFIVVAAPVGVTVSTLPPDASPITINGIVCYQSDGAVYQPVMENGVTAYVTIQPQ
ncbi:MAG: DUF6515 family protein [Verrucomicrobiota bacterium]|jgi:hypothetical protein